MRVALWLILGTLCSIVPQSIQAACGCGTTTGHRTSLLPPTSRLCRDTMIKTGASCCPCPCGPIFAGLSGSSGQCKECTSTTTTNNCCDIGDIAIGSSSVDNNALDTMYTITAAGKYFLSTNITLNPNNNNVTYLKITADCVDLNLNGLCIKQGNSATGIVAIKVNPGLKEVTIRNGAILNINGTGIQLNGSSISSLSTIIVQNMDIYGCSFEGLLGTYLENSLISCLHVTHCNGTHAGAIGAIGMRLDRATRVSLCDSIFNNNQGSTSVLGAGMYLTNCAECTIDDCTASNNWGANAYGFCLTSTITTNSPSSCNTFRNSSAEMNKSLSTAAQSAAYGFYINNSAYTTVFQSKACGQKSTSGPNDTHAYGFYSSASINTIFDQCYAAGNVGNGHSVNAVGAGFALENGDRFGTITESSSIANNILSPAGGTGYGIKLGGAPGTGNTVNATVSCNLMNNNGGTRTYGYKDFAACSTTLLQGNTAYGQGKTLTSGSGTITDTGNHNYVFSYTGAPSNARPDKVIREVTNGNLCAVDCCACPLTNLSINEVCP